MPKRIYKKIKLASDDFESKLYSRIRYGLQLGDTDLYQPVPSEELSHWERLLTQKIV